MSLAICLVGSFSCRALLRGPPSLSPENSYASIRICDFMTVSNCHHVKGKLGMLSFDYALELDVGNEHQAAIDHFFTLRCLPEESCVQHVLSYSLNITPPTELSYGTDGFGSRYAFGCIHEAHRSFQIHLSGKAEKYPDRRENAPAAQQILYRYPSVMTQAGPELRKAHQALCQYPSGLTQTGPEPWKVQTQQDPKGRYLSDTEARVLQIRDLIHNSMTYTPGATTPATSAEEAWKRRKGVCQDYAHIMLSLLRLDHIPCRYTAGLLLGEGESHAWVEFCDRGKWVPVDPTNPGVSWEEQIIFSHGRDSRDCEISRGTYRGPEKQIQHITSDVHRI